MLRPMEPDPEELFDAIDDRDLVRVRRLAGGERSLLAARDEGGLTPLMRAVIALDRDVELVGLLLEAGADARALTEDGEGLLHLAIDVEGDSGFGDEPLELFRPLVEAGAQLELRGPQGLTPLALAVVHGTPDEVAGLASLGARVDVLLPDDFETPDLAGASLLAAALSSPEKVEALLRHGAEPLAPDATGRSARDRCAAETSAAREAGHSDLAEALERSLRALGG
jgi:ankyrin repeat protein